MSRPAEPLSGQLVVLFGGAGFVGTHLAQELLSRGARLRVVSRHPDKAYTLKPLANLGQIQFVRADIAQTDLLPGLVAGASAVVNLVGAFAGDLDKVHVKAAGALASAARAAGVQAFVQVSANGADAGSPVDYARTKAEGEAAVLNSFPGRHDRAALGDLRARRQVREHVRWADRRCARAAGVRAGGQAAASVR